MKKRWWFLLSREYIDKSVLLRYFLVPSFCWTLLLPSSSPFRCHLLQLSRPNHYSIVSLYYLTTSISLQHRLSSSVVFALHRRHSASPQRHSSASPHEYTMRQVYWKSATGSSSWPPPSFRCGFSLHPPCPLHSLGTITLTINTSWFHTNPEVLCGHREQLNNVPWGSSSARLHSLTGGLSRTWTSPPRSSTCDGNIHTHTMNAKQ